MSLDIYTAPYKFVTIKTITYDGLQIHDYRPLRKEEKDTYAFWSGVKVSLEHREKWGEEQFNVFKAYMCPQEKTAAPLEATPLSKEEVPSAQVDVPLRVLNMSVEETYNEEEAQVIGQSLTRKGTPPF